VQTYFDDIALLLRQQTPATSDRRKLVLVIPCIPNPTDGASVVLYFWYAYALRHAGYKVLNVLLLQNEDDKEKLDEYRKLLEEDDNFRVVQIVCDTPIAYHKWLGPRHVDEGLLKEMSRVVTEFNPDALVCFDFMSAWATATCGTKTKIAWLGDLNFQSYWYNGIYAFQRKDYKNSFVNFLYSHPWKRCYKKALSDFKKIVVSSGSSVGQLAKLGLDSEYLPYPWPAAESAKRTPPPIPTLAFFGNLGALGSLSAISALVEDVYPKLIGRFGRGNFRIKIFGRGQLPAFAMKIISSSSEFETLGFVPDLGPLLAECHAMIAPIEAPVGNRSRILTALAHRLPVIAHTNTALGNPDLKSGINCCLGNTADEMLAHFYELIDDPFYADDIAENGYQLYVNKFHPLAASRALLQRIADAMVAIE